MPGIEKIKFINSLKVKKYRQKHGLFILEGDKLIKELLFSSFDIYWIIATSGWLLSNEALVKKKCTDEIFKASEREIKNISSMVTPQNVIAIVKIPQYSLSVKEITGELSVFLDNVQDPGNLGTIIRTADWFGIKHIFCNEQTVDVYNPKVIQATMGAILRVEVHKVITDDFFKEIRKNENFPVYGTTLNGNDLYSHTLKPYGLIIAGNESKGISDIVLSFITDKLFIPNYPSGNKSSESLNVSTAMAIVCAEFRRRSIPNYSLH